MSGFQTFVTERLAAITELLNAIGTNAKRIFELPVQNTLDPTSLIHVSRNGDSESLSVQKIIDAVNSGSYDKLISIGDITLSGNDATIPANAAWKINDIYYSNLADIVITIPLANTGLTRTDILVANTSNQIILVPGLETDGIAVRPNIPLNTVLVTEINVTDLSVGTPSTPIIGDNFISKIEKDGWADYTSTGDNAFIPAPASKQGLLIVYDAGLNSIDGVDFSSVVDIYNGKEYIIANRTGGPITLNHFASVSAGQAGFRLLNEQPLVLPDRGQIAFSNYNKVALTQTWKSWDDGYTKTEADDLLANKLDASAYNQHFKGVYVTLAALNSAHPTAAVGDYAQVNEVGATDVVNYNWDNEDGIWVAGGGTGGAANTDALPEGSTNLYHSAARVLATVLTGISFATGGAIVSTDSVLVAFGKLQKQITDTLTAIALKQDALVSGTNIKTINGNSVLGSGDITISSGSGDMVLASTQTVSGLKTFLSGMFGLRNVANTFTSFFTNANTASRTYTLQNRDGILADNTDLAGKMANPTGGIASYLPKFLTATTMGLSRLLDTGSNFGFGTVNAPTKQITLGNQANQEIGIEESGNTIIGRNLKISAGRTVNYVPNTNFNQFQFGFIPIGSMATAPNGTIYLTKTVGGGGLFKKSVGDMTFSQVTTPTAYLTKVTISSSGNVYVSESGTGVIYMQTAGAGAFANTGYTVASINQMGSATNGNVYAFTGNGIYMQTAGTGAFNLLQSGNFVGGCGRSDGDVFAISSNTIWKQTAGSGLFVNTTVASVGTQLAITPNNNFYTITGSQIYMQTNGTGSFNSLGQINNDWAGITSDLNSNVYAGGSWSSDGYVYFQNNDVVGTANLDGGALKLTAGTGKGIGQSRFEVYTGQKTVSGTDMQVETLREYIDENGYHIYVSIPSYANDAAADADANLPSGAAYKLTGNRTIFHKP